MADNIRKFRQDFGERAQAGYVVHTGDARLPLAPEVTALPFAEL
jgi:hypothetical protein